LSGSTKVYLDQVDNGYCFPVIQTMIGKDILENYARVMNSNIRFSRNSAPIVPPAAIASITIGELLSSINLPPGSIHMSEEIISRSELEVGKKINVEVVLKNKSVREGYMLISLVFNIKNEANTNIIIEAKTVLMIPQESTGE